jgi:hypothetical protein
MSRGGKLSGNENNQGRAATATTEMTGNNGQHEAKRCMLYDEQRIVDCFGFIQIISIVGIIRVAGIASVASVRPHCWWQQWGHAEG